MQLIKLNLARNCLKYLIRAYGINEIFVPYYTCQTVWNAIREEGCRISFYHIDENFRPMETFPKDAFIIYTNYFGLCSNICNELSKKYKNLIIDNSQAFYNLPSGLASVYSLRKFFKVPSGAFLYTEKTLSENFDHDKLSVTPVSFHEDYERFVQNELTLNNEKTIKIISEYSENLFTKTDFDNDKNMRLYLFKEYEKVFLKDNFIKLSLEKDEIPYCYPFCPEQNFYKEKLLKNKIILLRLWKNYPEKFPEAKLNNTVALPLTDIEYAEKIIKIFTKKREI